MRNGYTTQRFSRVPRNDYESALYADHVRTYWTGGDDEEETEDDIATTLKGGDISPPARLAVSFLTSWRTPVSVAPTRLVQMTEGDLAELERRVPELCEALSFGSTVTNAHRVSMRVVQQILSRIRWNYGPATDVEAVEPI